MPNGIKVKIKKGNAINTDFYFTDAFQIGRSEECDIQILEDVVSRVHARVSFSDGQWWISDLQSGNGVWINDEKIDHAPLKNRTTVELNQGGPALFFIIEDDKPVKKKKNIGLEKFQDDSITVKQYEDHYFGDSQADDIGQHTMMVRRAYAGVKKKQKRMYLSIITIVVCLFLVAGTYAVLKHLELQEQKKLAQEIFYSMKSLELDLADVLKAVRTSQDAQLTENVETYRAKIKKMEEQYDRFISSLHIYDDAVDEESRLILKMARTFGECEINIPEGFSKEVLNYINKWKSTKRLENALKRARAKGYISQTIEAMKANDLPPQLFYLGLQESNFNVQACGPKTRFGIAKGAWQFIPSTARECGLRTGPLEHEPIYDAQDERHHFGKSTRAAARYLRHIYDNEAQASGLLVIASYNWGQGRVIKIIKKMPKNPRERNFWRILRENRDKIPKETYDYVFYIFSAAVIGENPRLFGFDFDNPLSLS